MQFKSLLVASLMAIGAVANNGTDIAPSVQGRIAQLDLGFKQTDVMLNKLKHNIGGVTANECSQVLQPTRTSTYVPTGTGTQIPSATQSFTD
jgi:hypothetical protein